VVAPCFSTGTASKQDRQPPPGLRRRVAAAKAGRGGRGEGRKSPVGPGLNAGPNTACAAKPGEPGSFKVSTPGQARRRRTRNVPTTQTAQPTIAAEGRINENCDLHRGRFGSVRRAADSCRGVTAASQGRSAPGNGSSLVVRWTSAVATSQRLVEACHATSLLFSRPEPLIQEVPPRRASSSAAAIG